MMNVGAGSRQLQSFDGLLFDEVSNIDNDQDYWFQLRGHNINSMIDAATPLLGMAMRIRRLSHCDHVEAIYSQAVDEVKAIEVELTEAGYEHALILAYRYILCTFVDESVMITSWGADSIWAEHSLLTRFHNETWGGEKVFTILSRLQSEPTRYKAILEFIYLCLSLGFQGRYRVMENGHQEYQKVSQHLYQMLAHLQDQPPSHLTQASEHVVTTRDKLSKQVPIWSIFAGFGLLWIAIFIGYSFALHHQSVDVLAHLNQILH
ncbi:type IVB secretion system protein IcmH/DotU [Celerinatantimonas yamalensis]|uniref:Type IVB secretion system protein IcmH/DotU n=1 Tax=Celerinatantimonas yamalensis TaxID=559956 RepID=A0ABW9G633_9GAMM